MRARILVIVAFALGACAAPPAPVAPREARAPAAPAQLPTGQAASSLALRNPGFEEPPTPGRACPTGWDCLMHVSSDSFRFSYDEAHPAQGARSACFESVGKEPWGKLVQGQQHMEALRGHRVRLSALVRLENVAGRGAGPLLIAQGGSGAEVASRAELKAGSAGWHAVSAELEIPRSTFLLEVGFVLYGHGRICADQVRLEVL
jgi:hypothetical protein